MRTTAATGATSAKRAICRQTKTLRQQNRRLLGRVSNLKSKLREMVKQNKAIKEGTFEESIADMPPKQREAALHFFRASKRASTRGLKFTQNWILECLLMKMKSPKLYKYMRSNKILVLPSEDTLRKYLSSYKTGFGFCTRVLSALKKKTRSMDAFKRHGGLLIDEMKLSEHLSVTSAATIEGLVDLGHFTSKKDKCEPCDHGMVIMFAPFTGKWTQVLAVFATHGNVKGELLAKILVEAVLLAEDAGLFVDFVTCDGATWNRKMWKVLGIEATSENIQCRMRHPKDSSRYVHFLSDFPHLIKCLRNNLLLHDFNTPDGLVSLDAVKDVYAMDGSIVTLRVMHGIREAHLNPNNFEKMRVPYAYQLFGPQVTRGLRFYQQDVEPSRRSCIQATLRFFEMINSIINIMSSRYARVALRLNSSAVDCLYTFLAYLTEWESHVKGTRGFLSQSTAAGFRVTIKAPCYCWNT
nr:uncharacterized protein LOC119173843 [Rhipicephalus microplus]